MVTGKSDFLAALCNAKSNSSLEVPHGAFGGGAGSVTASLLKCCPLLLGEGAAV